MSGWMNAKKEKESERKKRKRGTRRVASLVYASWGMIRDDTSFLVVIIWRV